MKKSVLSVMVLICVLLCGCTAEPKKEDVENKIYGIWFSCFELDKMLTSDDFKSEFSSAVDNCANLGITDVFIHTRPFCDSLYPSKYFPLRTSVKTADFDVLDYIIEVCHKSNIRVHVWINPYRVKTDNTDITALPSDSPVRRWLEDTDTQNDNNVALLDGVYLNPAAEEATRLVLDGIREIIDNYEIDGIHFDDYFYPSESEDFDSALYQEYIAKTKNPLPLSDWRRQNINAFISRVNGLIKHKNADIIFSISPAASIEKNYNNLYADVSYWVQNGYVDWIIPQLYFGFNYKESDFRFDVLYSRWQKLSENNAVKLLVGLAGYKIDTTNAEESEEWASGNLIKRQMEYISDSSYGCCFFSYSSLFGSSPNQIKERENIKPLISN